MSTETSDIAAAVDRARRRGPAPQMPRVGVALSIVTSPTLHALLPRRVAVAAAEARALLLWRLRPEARERARAAMAAIVGGTTRASEVEQLARRHVVEKDVLRALFWQPCTPAASDARSRANLETALASGRGVLFSICHVGPYFDAPSPYVDCARAKFSVAGGWWFEPPTPDYAGRRLACWQRKGDMRGQRVLLSAGSFALLEALLEEGELVELFFDLPGSRGTRFLGKEVMLASGTARLAMSTGAIVVPARTRREGHRIWVDVAAPVDPREFTGAEQLHQALADVHSELILEFAETLEDPRRPGAWEAGATAERWIRSS